MRYLKFILIIVCVLFFVSAAYSAEKESFQFRKQSELQQIKPKKPVKIKLRRTAKAKYTWELKGDDADEIIKIDKKLRRILNVK